MLIFLTYLHGHAFVFVCYFDVMDPNVRSPDIDTIQSSLVAAANNHVVDFAAGTSVECKVESRC